RLVVQIGSEAGWVNVKHDVIARDLLIATVGDLEQHGRLAGAVDEAIGGVGSGQVGLTGGRGGKLRRRHQMMDQLGHAAASFSASASRSARLAMSCRRPR